MTRDMSIVSHFCSVDLCGIPGLSSSNLPLKFPTNGGASIRAEPALNPPSLPDGSVLSVIVIGTFGGGAPNSSACGASPPRSATFARYGRARSRPLPEHPLPHPSPSFPPPPPRRPVANHDGGTRVASRCPPTYPVGRRPMASGPARRCPRGGRPPPPLPPLPSL